MPPDHGESHSTELEAAYTIAERLSGGADEAAKRWRDHGKPLGWIGIDLNPSYTPMQRRRTAQMALALGRSTAREGGLR